MGHRIDHTGQVFGRLTVLLQTGKRDANGNIAWLCLCECGRETTVGGKELRSGGTKSCGCLFLEVAAQKGRTIPFKHGCTGTKTYLIWCGMRQRCMNPKDPKFARYGGRGIKVCDRWNEYQNFLSDMGECPSSMSIDRWPNANGNYEPGNCRWATQLEQQNNRTNNLIVELNGRKMTASEAAREHGLSPDTVHARLSRGDSIERALRPTRQTRAAIRARGQA